MHASIQQLSFKAGIDIGYIPNSASTARFTDKN